mgnify:CR=1 FL=1
MPSPFVITCVVKPQAAHAQLLSQMVGNGWEVKAVFVRGKAMTQHGAVLGGERPRDAAVTGVTAGDYGGGGSTAALWVCCCCRFA